MDLNSVTLHSRNLTSLWISSTRSILIALCVALLLSALGCSKTTSTKGDGTEGGLNEAELNALREKRFGEGGLPFAEGEGLFKDIYFDFDSTIVREEGRLNAEYNAKVLKDNANLNVMIEGHSDERGTNDYNLALGQERAKSVRDLLISFGIAKSRLETISYGEEVALDPGHDETAWAKNRRVHLSASSGAN